MVSRLSGWQLRGVCDRFPEPSGSSRRSQRGHPWTLSPHIDVWHRAVGHSRASRCRPIVAANRCQAIRAATRRRRRADAFLGDLDIVAHSGHALRSPPVGGLFIWGRAPGEALRPRGGRARRGRRRHAAPSAAPRYAPCRRRARRPRGGAPRTGASGKGRRSGPQQVRPSAPRPVAAPYPSASNCCTDLCDTCVRALADFEPRWCPRTRTTRCARAPASLGGSRRRPSPSVNR